MQVLTQQNGPLPIEIQFSAPADGPVAFFVSGSAWSASGGQWLLVTVSLDGNPIGTAPVFSNEAGSHRALIPVFIPVDFLSFGDHTITLAAEVSDTQTDQNDWFQVSLLY